TAPVGADRATRAARRHAPDQARSPARCRRRRRGRGLRPGGDGGRHHRHLLVVSCGGGTLPEGCEHRPSDRGHRGGRTDGRDRARRLTATRAAPGRREGARDGLRPCYRRPARTSSSRPAWLVEALDAVERRGGLLRAAVGAIVLIALVLTLVAPDLLPPRPLVGAAVAVVAIVVALAVTLVVDAGDATIR